MSDNAWKQQFRQLHSRAVAAWKAGRQSQSALFSPEDLVFLAAIGCSGQEMYDYIEDAVDYGDPDVETAIAIQEVRYDYFDKVLGRKPASRTVPMSSLPAKTDEADGIPWLPRAIAKARLKLRGEMPADLMFDCGGDRGFFRRMGMSPAAFLKLVWDCGDDDRKIIETVKRLSAKA